MKVPTYDAQVQRPRQGQGLPITAQLNASAMTAPARAFAESNLQLAQTGEKIADFGFKKAEIGAESEAQQASAALDIELQQMQLDFLQDPNMQNAERGYQERSQRLVNTYKGNMSNKLARGAFETRSSEVRTRNQIAFIKANNKRVVEQRTVLLDRDIRTNLAVATNPQNTPENRAQAADSALDLIDDAVTDLGPEKAEKLRNNFLYDAARDSLIQTIDQGADAEEVINDFRENRSKDSIVSKARQNLAQADIDKITNDLNSRSERMRTLAERKDSNAREKTTLEFELGLENMIEDLKVNADMADENTAANFMTNTDQMMKDALDGHDGSDESRAELSIGLRKLRTKHAIDLGDLQSTARRDNAKRKVGGDLRALVAEVSAGPQSLGTALETYDASISEVLSSFATTEEEEDARQGGREDLIQGALDGYIARGQMSEMRELYNSPGIQAALTPGIQEDYRSRIRDYDAKQDEGLREYRTKISLFEEVAGRPPTSAEKMRIGGFAPEKGDMDVGASFRKEFNALSKEFIGKQDSYNRVKLAFESKTNRIAGDFSMIFNIMKMLDPGVVRESEFRTIAEAGGLPARIQTGYNKVKGEELLPDDLRRQYKKLADELYSVQVKKQTSLQTQYTNLAKRLNYDPAEVIINYIGMGIDDIAKGSGDAGLGESSEEQPSLIEKPVIRLDANGTEIQ